MKLVSLVWFLLFCPFLFVFLLRLGKSNLDHDKCPFCSHQKEEEDFNCENCGFEFMENSMSPIQWLWAGGALLCSLSMLTWIESQSYQ
jgi:hypothetical protein